MGSTVDALQTKHKLDYETSRNTLRPLPQSASEVLGNGSDGPILRGSHVLILHWRCLLCKLSITSPFWDMESQMSRPQLFMVMCRSGLAPSEGRLGRVSSRWKVTLDFLQKKLRSLPQNNQADFSTARWTEVQHSCSNISSDDIKITMPGI